MAGSVGVELAVAVCDAGGLGSLPAATVSPDQLRSEVDALRRRTAAPYNVNFFCHEPPEADAARFATWSTRLAEYRSELGIAAETPVPSSAGRASFDRDLCDLVEELHPPVVSFHFGLPAESLVARVRATGAKVLSTATTVAEARWLEDRGCDAVIAQGAEAGGHRGMFLTTDPSTQVGTIALVPQVVDAVDIPVIAAGGIADARGILAALVLGASGAQIGTAFLRCPEALTSAVHRRALAESPDDATVITNVLTGRPARTIANRFVRELGPLSADAPAFPLATGAVAPLRIAAEARGSGDFSPLWSGQAARLAQEVPAGDLVRRWTSALDELARDVGMTVGGHD
jgi:nitronate monooxygenase